MTHGQSIRTTLPQFQSMKMFLGGQRPLFPLHQEHFFFSQLCLALGFGSNSRFARHFMIYIEYDILDPEEGSWIRKKGPGLDCNTKLLNVVNNV